jgi:hypothetical protein
MRRRWKCLLVVLLLVVAADAIFVAANRPDTKTRAAASAAINAEYGSDPSAGADASCEFEPDAELIAWRASYRCAVGICNDRHVRMRITHVLLGGWSFEVVRGGRVSDPTSGDTEPSASTQPGTDPGNCR